MIQNGNNQNSSSGNSNSSSQSAAGSLQNANGQGTTQSSAWGNANNHGQMQAGPGGQMPGVRGNDRMQGGPNGGGGKNSTFGGSETSSIFRLFSNNSLSDQIIWLLPFALIGFISAAIKEKLRFRLDNIRKQSIVMWLMWLLPMFIYFSFTKGLFHPYYLTMMAPPIAALTGIGFVSMWELRKEGGWKSWLLPISIISDAVVQLLILSYDYSTLNVVKILMAVVAALCFISVIAMQAAYHKKSKSSNKMQKFMAGIALAGMIITPFVWSSTTLFYTESGTFPSAGIELAASGGGMGGAPNNEMSVDKMNGSPAGMGGSDNVESLYKYLEANTTSEKYIVAVSSANRTGSSMIIKYGASVMALGGFSGSDNILSLSEFKKLVKSGTVRYIIAGGAGGAGGNSEIMSWAEKNGKLVSESQWSGKSTSSNTSEQTDTADATSTKYTGSQKSDVQYGGFGEGNSIQLYDLKGTVK